MFFMSWKDFDAYCTWLFSILTVVEKKSIFKYYTPQQMRLFGYIAEFLTQVYMRRYRKNTKELIVNVYRDDIKNVNVVLQIIKNLRSKIIFFLLKYL